MTKPPEPNVKLRKTKIVTLVTSLVMAAIPGVYSSWQSAKTKYTQRVEQETRDSQETDLQKNVVAAQIELAALSKSCVTHRDLVDLMLKMRSNRGRHSRVPHHRSPNVACDDECKREKELTVKIAALKIKSAVGVKARTSAKTVRRAAPELRPVKLIRQKVQQQLKAE